MPSVSLVDCEAASTYAQTLYNLFTCPKQPVCTEGSFEPVLRLQPEATMLSVHGVTAKVPSWENSFQRDLCTH